VLGDREAIATVAVRDLEAARQFYEGTLGLKLVHAEGRGARTYRSGGSTILVYQSAYAGTNKATAATWMVGDDIEAVARDLKASGVTFERYDVPGATLRGDVYVAPAMKTAWFKDPDGNIHALVGR
jgi:catechol 2,3-dioxygenase-like lactoylglutathione lyase family enzyme